MRLCSSPPDFCNVCLKWPSFERAAYHFVHVALSVLGGPLPGIDIHTQEILLRDSFLRIWGTWEELDPNPGWIQDSRLEPLLLGLFPCHGVLLAVGNSAGLIERPVIRDDGSLRLTFEYPPGGRERTRFIPALVPAHADTIKRALQLILVPAEALLPQRKWIEGTRTDLNRALGVSGNYPDYLERRRDEGELELERRGKKFAIRMKDPDRHNEVTEARAKRRSL